MFWKEGLSVYGMVLVNSFAILFRYLSSITVCYSTNYPSMIEEQTKSTNQTSGHDMSKNGMNLMSMMME